MAQSTADTWAPPVQKEVSAATSQHPRGDLAISGTSTMRLCFWIAAGFAWAVWAFAVRMYAFGTYYAFTARNGSFCVSS